MQKNKQDRIISTFKRSLNVWMGMRPLRGGETTTRSSKATGFITRRDIDHALAVYKTTVEHSSGRIDVTMSYVPMGEDRWVRVRVGNQYQVAFERSLTFAKGTHTSTIEKWLKTQLEEGLKRWE